MRRNRKGLSLLLAGMMLIQTAGSALALEFTPDNLFESTAAADLVQEETPFLQQEEFLPAAEENDLAEENGKAEENLQDVDMQPEADWQDESQEISFLPEEDFSSEETEPAEMAAGDPASDLPQETFFPETETMDPAGFEEESFFTGEDSLISPGEEFFVDGDDSLSDLPLESEPDFQSETGLEPGDDGKPEDESIEMSDPLQDTDSLATASVSAVLEDTEEQYIEADFPGNRNTLPFWETWIAKESWLFVSNDTYKGGKEFPLYFSNLRVSDPSMAEVEDRGDVWVIRSLEKYGSVTVTLDYEEPEATHKRGTHSFTLSISGDVYQLDLQSENGTHRLLPGKELTLMAKAYHEAYNREDGHHMEDAGSLTFVWSLPDPDQGPKGGLELVSTSDGTGLNLPDRMSGATAVVKAKTTAQPNAYPVHVTIYETASGENVKVGEQDYYIGVRPEYLQLTPSMMQTGLWLGGKTKEEPLLHAMSLKEDGSYTDEIRTEGVYFRWFFDDSQIQIMNDRMNQAVMPRETIDPGTTFMITRLSPHHIEFHLQAVKWDEESSDWEVLDDNYLWFDDLYTELRLEQGNHPYDGRNYLLYDGDGDKVTVCVDPDCISHLPVENPEDPLLQVRWKLGRYDDETGEMQPLDGYYTISPDGMSVTIDGKTASRMDLLKSNHGINIEVNLYYNNIEWAGTGTWVELKESREEYDLPLGDGGRNTLPYWDHFIDRWQNCYVENSEAPEGRNESFEIRKVSLTGGDTGIVTLEEQENGWYIRSQNAFGRAEFTVEYVDIHGAVKSYPFFWSVSGDEYDLDVWFADGNNWVQPGKTIELFAQTRHHAFAEGRGHYDEDTSAVTYQWILPEEAAGNLKVIEQSGGQAVLQAGPEEGYYNIRVEAYDPARSSTEPVAIRYMDLHVQKDYWTSTPGMIRNDLAPGESITVEPKVKSYGTDPDGNSVEEYVQEVRFRWYFDENQISIVDGNGETIHPAEDDSYVYTSGSEGTNARFTLTRKSPVDFEVGLQFFAYQNGEWRECGWRNYWMDRADVRFSLAGQNLYDHYVVFDSGTVLLSIDPDSLENIDRNSGAFEFEWLFGRYDEGRDDLDTSYGNSFYTVSENGLSATVDGQALRNIPELWDHGVDVRVKLLYNGEEIRQEGTFIETRYYEDEVDELHDDDMLPGWTNEYRFVNHRVWNEQYPEGEDLECMILEMTAQNEDPKQADPVVTVTKRNDGTWLVKAGKNYGCAVISYKYDRNGTVVPAQFRLYVTDEWVRSWIRDDEDYNQILPGQKKKKLYLDVVRKKYTAKDGEVDVPTDDLTFEWNVTGNEDPAVANAITLTPAKDKRSATLVAARDFRGGAAVEVIIYDGAHEVNRTQWWFNVQEGMDVLVPTQLDLNLRAGKTYGPFEVYREERYLDEEGNIKTEKATYQNFRYRWEFDTSLVQIKDTDGKAVGSYKNGEYVYTPGSCSTFENGHTALFTIKKLKHEEARIILVEQWADGKGNYHDGHRREYLVEYNGTHVYGAWKVTKPATALAAGTRQRVCSICGHKQTQTIAKLKPAITVKAGTVAVKTKSTITLKKGRTASLTFSGLAKGDAFYSVKSSNAKIAGVNRSGSRITIKGVKAGKAIIKLFLKSNKKTPIYQITVKVQAGEVRTTGITIAKSFSVKVKKKITLKPVLKPFTSTQKITYSVAKKYAKIIKVTSAGVVTGLKKGTGIVVVQSGTKKVNVKIVVK